MTKTDYMDRWIKKAKTLSYTETILYRNHSNNNLSLKTIWDYDKDESMKMVCLSRLPCDKNMRSGFSAFEQNHSV